MELLIFIIIFSIFVFVILMPILFVFGSFFAFKAVKKAKNDYDERQEFFRQNIKK